MWLIQIVVGSFWLYMGTAFLFREAAMWETVENIDWFRNRFVSSTTRRWERFCRDVGIICLATGCLLFITLPFGVGLLGVMIFVPPIALFM